MQGLDALQLSGAHSVVDLCCEVDAGGMCTSNLQPGGLYKAGERHVCCGSSCMRNWHQVALIKFMALTSKGLGALM